MYNVNLSIDSSTMELLRRVQTIIYIMNLHNHH